jgi:hypothetical protein
MIFGLILNFSHPLSLAIVNYVLLSIGAWWFYKRRRRAAFTCLGVVCAVGAPGFGLVYFNSGAVAATRHFWITRSLELTEGLRLPVFIGPVAVAALIACLVTVARRRMKRWESAELELVALLLLCLVPLYAIATIKPFLLSRYLAAWFGVLSVPLAVLTAPLLSSWLSRTGHAARVAAALIGLALPAAGMAGAGLLGTTNGDWRTPAAYISRFSQCRQADMPIMVVDSLPTASEVATWRPFFSYYDRSELHFQSIQAAPPVGPGREMAPGRCPLRLWASSLKPDEMSLPARAALRRLCSSSPTMTKLQFSGGFLLTPSGSRADTSWTGPKSVCNGAFDS